MFVQKTDFPLPCKRGKVRDIYDLDDKLLIVTTDRISAFDKILPNCVTYKGKVLNLLSEFWFKKLKISNHLITTDILQMKREEKLYHIIRDNEHILEGRSALVGKYTPIPIECVVRGFLAGSAWSEYQKTGYVCGTKLPKGLKENHPLPEPLFTPATKVDSGHDINITVDQMIDVFQKLKLPSDLWEKVVEKSIDIYKDAAVHAFNSGLILSDTKLEWAYSKGPGFLTGGLVLIDEVLTPDSSRFWAIEDYQVGKSVNSYDKQYVRDYLNNSGWDKESDPPTLPPEVIHNTSLKYLEAYKLLTGKDLQ